MEPPWVRGRTERSAWGYIHHVNKLVVIDVPIEGYVNHPALTKPRPPRVAATRITLHASRRRAECSSVHSRNDPAYVAARPHRRRDDPSDHVSYTHLRAHETDSYLVCR